MASHYSPLYHILRIILRIYSLGAESVPAQKLHGFRLGEFHGQAEHGIQGLSATLPRSQHRAAGAERGWIHEVNGVCVGRTLGRYGKIIAKPWKTW